MIPLTPPCMHTTKQIANDIRHVIKNYTKTIPTVLEIPSKDHPYVHNPSFPPAYPSINQSHPPSLTNHTT